jgi:DNA-binding transcriptional ArsR family regulator
MTEELKAKAQLLKTLGHPVRLKIVAILAGKCAYVNELIESLDLPQAVLSQHLKVMKKNGILKSQREGVRICYSLKNETISGIVKIFQLQA